MVAPSTQPTLFGRSEAAEEAVATAYVPFLLDKGGERAALEQAPAMVWDGMIPCIQILPPDARKEEERRLTPRQVIDRLRPAVARNLFYLDAAGVARASRRSPRLSVHEVEAIYRAATLRGLGFIPVLPFERADVSLLTVAIARDAGLGLGVRVRLTREPTSGGASLASRLASTLDGIRVRDLPIDLFVDLEYLDPNLEVGAADVGRAIASLRSQHSFRTVTLLATSIPPSMSAVVDEGDLRPLPRTEWMLYLDSQLIGGAERFGDYGVQHCVPPDPGRVKGMVASIRFGDEHGLWVARDVGPLDALDYHEKGDAYRRLAARMLDLKGFVGRACCQGDRDIEDIADGRFVVRSQGPLRRIATLHTLHLGSTLVLASRASRARDAAVAPRTGPVLEAPPPAAGYDQPQRPR
jgi:T4 beta protein